MSVEATVNLAPGSGSGKTANLRENALGAFDKAEKGRRAALLQRSSKCFRLTSQVPAIDVKHVLDVDESELNVAFRAIRSICGRIILRSALLSIYERIPNYII